jgi:hypothetical protein
MTDLISGQPCFISFRISTYIDFELGKVNADNLVDEPKSREREVLPDIDNESRLLTIFYAFKFGREDGATHLNRTYIAGALGKIL